MNLEFPTKGMAVISVIAAGFSLKQCAKLLDMTSDQVGILAAATRRRKHIPTPISEEIILKLESLIGKRAAGKHIKTTLSQKKRGSYKITIELPD